MSSTGGGETRPATRERLLAALGYVGPAWLVGMFLGHSGAFTRWHLAQACIVFGLEAVALGVSILLDATIGRIPWLGLLVMVVFQVAAFAGFLALSILGIIKSLAGERLEIPWIERYARRFPGVSAQSQ